MKRFVASICVFGFGFGLGAGCDGGGAVEVDEFGKELGRVSCRIQFECCTDAEIMEQYMGLTLEGEPITTEEQCVTFTDALVSSFLVAQYKKSIAAGRVEYSADAAGSCIDALDGLSCSDYSSGMTDQQDIGCEPFIVPKVADGDGCLQDYECISDNCVGAMNSIGEDPVDGACMPLPAPGAPCDDNCTDGNYCDFDLEMGMDICKPLEVDGAACSFDDDCVSGTCDMSVCVATIPVCDGR